MKQLGHLLRLHRQQKGLYLKEFAEQLGVSTSYLSNLETGQTDTIRLSHLEKVLSELNLLPRNSDNSLDNGIDLRIQNISYLLKVVESTNPQLANYLLAMVEQGIDVYLNPNSPPGNI
jgi:transcriptional regulator with XRE-family HTH domain